MICNKVTFKWQILLVLFVFTLLACSRKMDTEESIKPCLENNQIHQSHIPKEVAVLIARGRISYEYDPVSYDEVVIDKGENWLVGFTFKSKFKNDFGGQPTVIVNKENGNVVDYVFPK